MISLFVLKLFLIVQLVTSNCNAKDTCNGSCLTKTYNVQDSVSVTFTAKQIKGINYLTIILTGYNINENEYQHVSVAIDGEPGINTYICERNTSGSIDSFYTHGFGRFPSGSSLYRDNTLYCIWTMPRTSDHYPKKLDGSSLELEIDSHHKILLANDDISFLVATDTKDLPIYQMNFLKCCNEVYGNDKIQLFVRQTDNSNDFTIQLTDIASPMPRDVFVQLTGSDSSQFTFHWFVPNQKVYGDVKMDYVGLLPINKQISYNYVWSEGVCTWSIPIVIKGFSEDYDTRNRGYDLKISLDGKTVYTKSGITLKSLGLKQIPSIFFVFSVFLFHQILY